MPAIPPFWATEAEVPDVKLKDCIKKHEDGRVFIDVSSVNGWALTDVSALERSLSSTRKERDDARNLHKTLETSVAAVGDLEEARLAVERVKALEGARSKTEVERLLAEKDLTWKTKYETDLKVAKDEAQKYFNGLKRAKVTDAIRAGCTAAGADADLLMPHLEPSVRLREFGEDWLPQVVDEAGQPRFTRVAGSSGEMSLGERIQEMRLRFPSAFKGTPASGSGVPAGSGNGAPQPAGQATVANDRVRVRPEDIIAGKIVREGALRGPAVS